MESTSSVGKQGLGLAMAIVIIILLVLQISRLKPQVSVSEEAVPRVEQHNQQAPALSEVNPYPELTAKAETSPESNINRQISQPIDATQIPYLTAENSQNVVNMAAWYLAFRKAYPYDLDSVQLNYHFDADNKFVKVELEGGDPLVLETYRQLFHENPQVFIELTDLYYDDAYLNAVFISSLSSSNITLLEKPIREGKTYFADLATEFGLHIQNPNLYLDLYRSAQQQNITLLSRNMLTALVEIDYWQFRENFIQEATNNRYPAGYFSALEGKNDIDLNVLANQMWQQHKLDQYSKNSDDFGSGKEDRVSLAIKYGIAEAWDDAYDLLMDGATNEWQFTNLGLTNPKKDFPSIKSALTYDRETQRWSIPESMRTIQGQIEFESRFTDYSSTVTILD